MSIDQNCGSLLNFGLLWQHRKCTESPSYSRIFLCWTCMSEIIFRPYFSLNMLNWQMRNTKFKKTSMVAYYEHIKEPKKLCFFCMTVIIHSQRSAARPLTNTAQTSRQLSLVPFSFLIISSPWKVLNCHFLKWQFSTFYLCLVTY